MKDKLSNELIESIDQLLYLEKEFNRLFVINDTLDGKSVKRIMAADTKNVFKWFKSKLKEQAMSKKEKKDEQLFCRCYEWESFRDDRDWMIIKRGLMCCRLCKLPLNNVAWENNAQ